MVDRIDIGAGPRLGFEPTDTSGFTFTPKEELTREQYLSQDVNFARQTLKPLTGLREETGIGVDAPEVGEDIDVTGSSDSSPETDLVDIYGTIFDNNLQEQVSKAQFGFEETGSSEYASYSDYLQTTGNVDRVNDVNNFYEPLAVDVLGNLGKGKFGDITFENFDLSFDGAGDRIEKSIKDQLTTKDLGKRAMSAAFSAAGGIFGSVMGSVIGGTQQQDEFGDPSLRPSGALGALYDISMSRSYDIMNNIKAANNATSTDPFESRGTFGQFGDVGFSAKLGGGRKILRDVGSNAYFKTGGLSFEQAKNIEAFSKGYIVNTYSFDQEGGTNIFGQQKNVKVEDIGGAFAGRDGYYTPDGKFYSTRYQTTSKFGPESAIGKVASQYGVSDDIVEKALEDARAGKGTVKGNIDKAIADEREKQRQADLAAAAAAEAERKRKEAEAERRRRQQANQDSNDSGGMTDFGGRGSFGGSEGYGGGIGTGGGAGESFGSYGGFADGGTVGMAAGGAMAAGMGSGFVDRPPSQVPEEQTVADDVETKMPEGAFVINAAAVEFAGEEDIKKMLNDAQKEAVRRGIAIDNSENSAKLIDVAISRGEVTVAPYLAKIIGYDRLNKINNRGKPETKERLQEAAQGGMLDRPGYASGDKVTVYRGEPIDVDKSNLNVDYGYGKEDVGKFHTPSIEKARNFAHSAGPGNQQILSRKVTIDELFEGVEEAWKTHAKQKTDYFKKMPKSELDKNLRFIRNMKKAYETGERSLESMVMFLQEQVFHDDKSKVNFIETFKNDPKSAGKLAGKAISKVATKAAPPLAILEMVGTVFAPTTMGDATLQGDESFLNTNLSATR